jgi:hypothetical protein
VNGNLFVNSSLDVNGNTASFGVNGANPGYSLIYTNGTLATVDFSATAPGVNWIWSQATNQPQLKLGSTNTLSLFAPGSALAAITLNPAGTSTFSQGLTVTGTLTATGGLASPNGIVSGGTSGLSLQAGGTGNQNITLVPTGTGVTTTASPVTVTNATASTSTSTGALIVTGGVGVNGTLTAGNVTTGGTVNAGTLKVTNVDTSLTNLGLGTANTANFGAINAADPSFFYPAPVAKVSHTAPSGPFLSTPQVVTVAGNFAYVGSSSSSSFQILDITNPLLPVKRGSLVGTGVVPAANLAYPRGIAISGNYAYVTSQTNNALQVINITNRDAPVAAGSLLNGAGGALLGAPYGIAVSGNYAYIASSSSNALEIVNIANPAVPVHAGKLVDATKLLGARAVAVAGNYAYVVSNTGNTLTVINVSNPTAPTLAATLAHNAAGPLLAGPTAIAISGNYAYVTSATSNALQIIDISNPLVPVAKGALVSGTAGAQLTTPSALTVVGTTAFVTSSGTTKAVQIVDVSNPLAPTPRGQLLDGIGGAALNGPTGIAVAGNYAYVASSSSNALQVLSIASGGGFQIKNATVLTTDVANNLLLGSGLPTGKVAIGTTNATSRLSVAGIDATAANSVVNFTDSTGKSLLLVRNDGNVGIGTTTPSAKLDVAGDAKISGTLTVGGQDVVTANQLATYASKAEVAPFAKPTALYDNSGNAISSVQDDGKVNFASGLSAGLNASAYGKNSTAMGVGSTADGENSIAMGYYNRAIGENSIAMGLFTTASGSNSTAIGLATEAGGNNSTAMGMLSMANAYGSTVIGRGNVVNLGNSPLTWVDTDDLFVIGNGRLYLDDDGYQALARSNALSVKKNGETYIQGNVGIGITTPTVKLDVAGDAKISGTLTVGDQAVVTAPQLATYATTAQVSTQLAPYQLAAGSGAGLNALNASALTTGTLPAARIAAASVTNDKLTTNPLARANHTGTQAWSTLTATPTTIAGYGINDAVKKTTTGDVTVAGVTTLQGAANVTGATTLRGAVTVKTVLRLPPSGDLSMGTFTTGLNPAN